MFKRNPLFIIHFNSETGIPPMPVFEKRFIVGRKPTHVVAIPDNSVSRDHIEIVLQSNQIYVMDLGTSNGTKLDGHRIPENMPTPYREGQLLNLGNGFVTIAIELFEEDREKRKNNPSAKAMQLFNSKSFQNTITSSSQSDPIPPSSLHFPPSPSAHSQSTNLNLNVPSSSPEASTVLQTSIPTTPANIIPSNQNILKNEPHPVITQQTREDANRLIAKAKIEAEIAAKELLKNKASEAQKIIHQAESKVSEKLKETEAQIQQILQNARNEAQQIKLQILNDAEKEKEVIHKDAESIKKTIPALMEQIEQLKLQTQKYQAEKNSAEALFSQEHIRLEKLNAELAIREKQLKQITQQIELANAKVQEAEAKYAATVSANQNLIEETKKALEQAQAKDKELTTLLANAKKEHEAAIEFASHHRADAEAYAKVTKEEVDLYSQNLRTETENWVTEAREKTDLELKQKNENFRIETEKLITERENNYQEVKLMQEKVLEELRNTEAIKLKNLEEIDVILKKKAEDFEENFKVKCSNLEAEYESRKIAINGEFKTLKDNLEAELSNRRSCIEREMLERRETLERESAEKKQLIEKEAQELRALRDKEYKELKTQQDSYLFDVKKREEDRLKAMIEESRQLIREQFNAKNNYVQKTFTDFFTHYSQTAPTQLREALPDLQNQLGEIIKDALVNEVSGEDKQLKQLFEFDPTLQKKHKKFWIKLTAISTIILIAGGYLLYDPRSLSKGAQSITESVNELDRENKQIQAEALEQIKKASIYSPDKTNDFKDTYTDNVLYTNHYLDFEKDDQYRSQWIVSIKEYLIQEAKLIDDKADEIISKEGSLIIALSSETIDGRNPERGIMRMREKETTYMQLIAASLSEDKKKIFFEKKKSFFERYINDPIKFRGPAGK